MSYNEKKILLNSGVSISFLKRPDTRKKTWIFIPGGPGLSSCYYKKFLTKMNTHLDVNIAIADLPNHDSSKVFERITFDKASAILLAAIKEVQSEYYDLSIFAHSLGGCLIMNSGISSSNFNKIIFCDVPYKLSHSKKFTLKKAKNELINTIDLDAKFSEYFSEISYLYFYKHKNYSEKYFFENGFFWKNGKNILNNCKFDLTKTNKIFKESNIYYFVGKHDIVLPTDNMSVIRKFFKDTNIVIYKNSGHFPFIEEPNSVFSTLKTICI